jgi:hypothetical protein
MRTRRGASRYKNETTDGPCTMGSLCKRHVECFYRPTRIGYPQTRGEVCMLL